MKQSSILKNQKNEIGKKLRNYRTRKSQLETIRNNLNSSFEGCAWNITNFCNRVKEGISLGIVMEGGNVTPENLFKNEEGISDYNISQARNYLNAEINSVESKISDLEREMTNLNFRIHAAEEQEREELRKQLEALLS